MPHTHDQEPDDTHHVHSEENEQALEDQNKKHWDERAKDYEFPASAYMTSELAQAISDRFLSKLDGKDISLLDYACGPGLVSYRLLEQGRVKKIVGVDVSTGMVEEFNKKAEAKGLKTGQAHAVAVVNHGLQASLDGELFDVVMCNHAYHHFDNVKAVTATLASVLKPGGILVVADFLAADKPFIGGDSAEDLHKHGVHHAHGFKAETLQAHFKEAGLTNVQADTSFSISKQKLKELGGDESPLKRFLADAEANPDVRYVLASGQKAA